MVAIITHPKKVHSAIYYNEHKVAEKGAELILAAGFLKEKPLENQRFARGRGAREEIRPARDIQ